MSSAGEYGGLRREVGLPEAVVYGAGIIIGAGIYSLIGEAAATAGNALWLAFLLAALISAFTALSYAELGSMFPRSGAEYFYVKHAFDSDALAFITGWLIILVEVIAGATVALGFGGYLESLTGVDRVAAALLLLALLGAVNYAGIKQSVRLNMLLTLVSVLGLLMVVAGGSGKIGSVNYFEMSYGLAGLLTATTVVFFAYLGFEDLANLAEEIKQPERNLPLAILLALGITTLLYVLVAVAAVSVVPWQEFAESSAPLAVIAEGAGIPGWIIVLIALSATSSTVLIFQIASSRMLYGVAKDGALPRALTRVHPARGTPHVAIAAATLLSMGFVLTGEIRFVALLTDFSAFVIFALVNLSAVALRVRRPGLRRPFRAPLNLHNLPLVSILGAVSCGAMLLTFGLEIVAAFALLLLAGLGIHLLRAKGL
ncbi:MAG: amino acid permease [Euryarchaeota archaeon]|nr:amino acid permease [Euryarchaeota archaeon]